MTRISDRSKIVGKESSSCSGVVGSWIREARGGIGSGWAAVVQWGAVGQSHSQTFPRAVMRHRAADMETGQKRLTLSRPAQ